MAYRGYKYRLYPDIEARAYFARCFGATRYCYNYCVRKFDESCAEGQNVSGFYIMALARQHINSLEWMADVDYEIKESAPKRFDNALGKYLRHEANRPREHKKGEQTSISYTTGGVVKVDFKHGLVQLPKIGIVKARLHRSFEGDIKSATVKHEADGNYYISFTVDTGNPAASLKPHTDAGTVGVDVGLRHLATLSNGDTIDLPEMNRIEERIKFLNERHEKQTKGSRRYNRTAKQIARLRRHQANITKDSHHKAAVRMCRDYDTICMETLNVKGMMRGETGNRTSADKKYNAMLHRSALASLVDRVRRKAADTGTNFVTVDLFEPTTKRCHVCGYTMPYIDLHTSEWTCHQCGTHHDRDINAAINIRNKGIELLQAEQPKADTIEQLPLAEGNVKPEKETTAGCDLRTGKGIRSPKAQIVFGTAPPRIFNNAQRTEVNALPFLRVANFIKEFGIKLSLYAITSWLYSETPSQVPKDKMKEYAACVDALLSLADKCRSELLQTTERIVVAEQLGRMNRVTNIGMLTKEAIKYKVNFTWWRTTQRTQEEIDIVNRIYTQEIPEAIENFVARCRR